MSWFLVDSFMREEALAHRRHAEVLERHEVDRLALTLVGTHDEIERGADHHADEAVHLALHEYCVAGGRVGDLDCHLVSRDLVDREQQIEYAL